MTEEIFDFGFTAVTQEELDFVQQTVTKLESTSAEAEHIEQKLNKLYSAVQPLLNNLKANPEKDYIYWPNRQIKVEEFSDYLDKIYNS